MSEWLLIDWVEFNIPWVIECVMTDYLIGWSLTSCEHAEQGWDLREKAHEPAGLVRQKSTSPAPYARAQHYAENSIFISIPHLNEPYHSHFVEKRYTTGFSSNFLQFHVKFLFVIYLHLKGLAPQNLVYTF